MPITHVIPAQYDYTKGMSHELSPERVETFAHGKVLEVGVQTCRIMSDVWGSEKYAKYWDSTEKRVKHYTLDICDYQYSYGDRVHAEVDATEEVYKELEESIYQDEIKRLRQDAENASWNMQKGDFVEVFKGRNGKGTKGKIVVEMLGSYNMGWKASERYKFAVAINDEKIQVAGRNGKVYDNYKNVVWAWSHNCRLLQQKPIDMKEIEDLARGYAKRKIEGWRKTAVSSRRRLAA